MASDYLLAIDGIKGEGKDSKHPGTIEIESFSWGVSNAPSTGAGGGGGAGKAAFNDIHFATTTSKASPSLFLACASGMHFKKAVLTVRKSGGDQQDFYKVTLTDLLVSSFSSTGADNPGADAVPTDQFSLNFARLEFSVLGQQPDGSLDAGTTVGWDLKKNQKI